MPAGLRTVKAFVSGTSPAHAQESLLALHAKAISLMEHATRIAHFIAGGTGYVPVEASQLHQCIEQFKQELPEIPPMNSSRVDLIPGLLMIHIIAHCATVQLFQSRESQGGRVDTESKTARAITSAVWLLRQIDYSRIKHVDAFLGAPLFTLAHTLKNSLSAITMAAANTPLNAAGSLHAVEARLIEQLRVIVTALTAWGGTSPFMRHQREMIEQL